MTPSVNKQKVQAWEKHIVRCRRVIMDSDDKIKRLTKEITLIEDKIKEAKGG